MELKAGQIVTVDWRKDPGDPERDPHPPEPNKLRPAVVVQDCALFDIVYPTVLVVPMTRPPEELQQLRQLVMLAIGGLT